MGKSSKAKRGPDRQAPAVARRRFTPLAAGVTLVALIGAAGLVWMVRHDGGSAPAGEGPSAVPSPTRGSGQLADEVRTGSAKQSTDAAAGQADAQSGTPELRRLEGRWLRPDGGYVLEIRRVASDGQAEAAYFNPRSIHVARAEASKEQGAVRLFVELRDVNYPGSTYALVLSPDGNEMRGAYFQAVQQETFEVLFVRQ